MRIQNEQGTEQPRLTPAEAKQILQALEKQGTERPGPTKRHRRTRVPYNSRQIALEIEDGSRQRSRIIVQGRNLSIHGMSVVHTQFVHTGRECIVTLPSLKDQEMVSIAGKIQRCRLVSGRVHEIAILFDVPIDLSQFVKLDASEDRVVRQEMQAEIPDHPPDPNRPKPIDGCVATGAALVVDDFASNRKLLAFWLTKLGLTPVEASNPTEAESILGTTKVDVMIVDADLGAGDDGLKFVRHLRQRNVAHPVLCVSADTSEECRNRALAVGCNDFLSKPFERGDFQRAVTALLVDDPYGPLHSEPIRSSMADDPDTLPLLKDFVTQVKELGELIRTAVTKNETASIANMCSRLAESGKGYGLEPITMTAKKVTEAVQQAPQDSDRLRRELDRLLNVIARVEA